MREKGDGEGPEKRHERRNKKEGRQEWKRKRRGEIRKRYKEAEEGKERRYRQKRRLFFTPILTSIFYKKLLLSLTWKFKKQFSFQLKI